MLLETTELQKYIKDETIEQSYIDDTKDAILDDVVRMTKNNFVISSRRVSLDGAVFDNAYRTITLSSKKLVTDYKFKTGDIIYIRNTFNNNGYVKIKSLTETIITIDDDSEIFDETIDNYNASIYMANFPKSLYKLISELIEYNYGIDNSIASESYARHSVTYNTDYPPNLMRSISKFNDWGY